MSLFGTRWLAPVCRTARSAVKYRCMIRCFSETLSPVLPGLSNDQLQRIANTDHALRTRHEIFEAGLPGEDKLVARRKRMIYRSKQRGWLEADILMGSWATENIPKLSESELDQYDIILSEETVDIFNFICGRSPLPDRLANLSVMQQLMNYTRRAQLSGPKEYEAVKIKTNLT
jgi:succinate dehydrogenase flavin-adding protein (antitoxin of CptAB toxin-antitoxin module)